MKSYKTFTVNIHTYIYGFGKLCNEILMINPKIRYAGICDKTGETKYGGQREGVKTLLSSEETKKSNLQAIARWALRNTLSRKVGKGRYAMAEYEKAKRITIPLELQWIFTFDYNRSGC